MYVQTLYCKLKLVSLARSLTRTRWHWLWITVQTRWLFLTLLYTAVLVSPVFVGAASRAAISLLLYTFGNLFSGSFGCLPLAHAHYCVLRAFVWEFVMLSVVCFFLFFFMCVCVCDQNANDKMPMVAQAAKARARASLPGAALPACACGWGAIHDTHR